MKLSGLVMVLAGLCVATTAKAGEPLEIITADVTGPPGEPGFFRNWEFGAQFAMPLPASDLATDEIGISTGVTLTGMLNPGLGVGLDILYHDWPTSDAFKASYNAMLRDETSNLVQIGATNLRLKAMQISGHLKLPSRSNGWMRPWLQIGAGAYIVDPTASSFSGGDMIYLIGRDATLPQVVGGASVSSGVDLVRSGHMKFGLDASYDHLWSTDAFGSNFDAFAVGGHLLFGR